MNSLRNVLLATCVVLSLAVLGAPTAVTQPPPTDVTFSRIVTVEPFTVSVTGQVAVDPATWTTTGTIHIDVTDDLGESVAVVDISFTNMLDASGLVSQNVPIPSAGLLVHVTVDVVAASAVVTVEVTTGAAGRPH